MKGGARLDHATTFPEITRPGLAVVYAFQRGVLFSDGRFDRVVDPGRFRIWPFTRRRLIIVDMRETTDTVNDQKLLSQEHLPLTISVRLTYAVEDPALAVQAVQNVRLALHADTQQELRALICTLELEAILGERDALNTQLTERLRPRAQRYGLAVSVAAIRDVMLTPRMRDLLMKEGETSRLARASLSAAREEVATVRAMLNAARIVRDHPEILRLRELELMREAIQQGRHTFVLGQASPTLTDRPQTRPSNEAPPAGT